MLCDPSQGSEVFKTKGRLGLRLQGVLTFLADDLAFPDFQRSVSVFPTLTAGRFRFKNILCMCVCVCVCV